jgi:hypothetical protein
MEGSLPSHSKAPRKQALQVALPARTEEQSTSQASFFFLSTVSLISIIPCSFKGLIDIPRDLLKQEMYGSEL